MARGFFSTEKLELRRPLRRIDPSRIPVEFAESGRSLSLWYIILGLMGTAPGVVLLIVVGGKPLSQDDWLQLGMLAAMVLLVGLAGLLFLYGLWRYSTKTIITLRREAITVARVTPVRLDAWTEPTLDYAGVLLRSETRPYDRGEREVHLLELRHPDAERNVVVYESDEPKEVVACWPLFCRALGLPALELDGRAVVKKPAANLEHSARKLVASGKRPVRFHPSGEPPDGLDVAVRGDALSVTVLDRKPYPAVLYISLVILIVSQALGRDGKFRLAGVALGLGLAGLVGLVMFATWLRKDHIEIRPGRLRIGTRFLGMHTKGKTFASSQVRSVTVDGKDGVVRVRTDETLVSVGGGLSPGALRWLRDCIEAAVSAPSCGGDAGGC